MAFAHHHGERLARGPRRRSWPLPAVPEKRCLQGKGEGFMILALWGSHPLVWLFWPHRAKYCHDGGMGSPSQLARQRGEDRASPIPTPTPINRLICRRNATRVRESSSFGGEDQLVWLNRRVADADGGSIARSAARASARRSQLQQRGSARSPAQTTARPLRGRARGRVARDRRAEGRARGPASRYRR
jgi:hypothetical protein